MAQATDAPRRYIVLPFGSAGDVLPLVWLARQLQSEGAEVEFICQEIVSRFPRQAGLPTRAYGEAFEQEAILRDPALWDRSRAHVRLAQHLLTPAREQIQALEDAAPPQGSVLLAGGLALGARIFSEASGIPLLTVHLQPAALASVSDPPVFQPGWEWIRLLPRFLVRTIFGAGYGMIDWAIGRELNALRKKMGLLQPARQILYQWWHSPHGVLALFPEWFAAPQPDWPRNALCSRFPLYDGTEDGAPLPDETRRFISAGPPPILATPGTAYLDTAEYFTLLAEGARLAGRRLLLVSPSATRFAEAGEHVHTAAHLPFSSILPSCCLAVHHGGIGTAAQALDAGVPQLITPFAFDQPDNASRLSRFGVAQSAHPKRLSPEKLAAIFRTLPEDPEVRQACLHLQEKIRSQMPPSEVTGRIRRLLAQESPAL